MTAGPDDGRCDGSPAGHLFGIVHPERVANDPRRSPAGFDIDPGTGTGGQRGG